MKNNEKLDRGALRDMGMLEFTIMLFCRKPMNEMFHRVIGRAYERGIIDSNQLHDIAGIWNRMVNGL